MVLISEKNIARIFSIIFHPILIPSWAFLALILYGNPYELGIISSFKWQLFGIVFATSFMIPAIIILLMQKFRLIKSIMMDSKNERIAPLIVAGIFFYTTHYLLKSLGAVPIFSIYMLGATTLVIISLVVTIYWKISLHLIGWGGLTAASLVINLITSTNFSTPLIFCILISGFTATSRMLLNSHKPSQIYVGFLTGFCFIFGLFYFIFF